MKKIIIYLLVLFQGCLFDKINAEVLCASKINVNNLFTANMTLNGNYITVSFEVNSNNLFGTSFYFYYGDGNDYIYEHNYYLTKNYSLSDSRYVSGLNFNINVALLTVDEENNCIKDEKSLSYTIPNPGFIFSFFAEPIKTTYAKNENINFKYNLSTDDVENLSYNLLLDGVIIQAGNITVENLNNDVTVLTKSFSTSGSHNILFILYRNSVSIDNKYVDVTISEEEIGDPPEPIECQYNENYLFDTKIELDYNSDGSKIAFNVFDISNIWTIMHSSCGYDYSIQVISENDGSKYYVNGSDYTTSFSFFANDDPNYQFPAPSPVNYSGPAIFVIKSIIGSNMPENARWVDIKTVIVPPKPVNPETDNVRNLSSDGGTVSFNTFTDGCVAVEMFNKNQAEDDLSWINSYSMGSSALSFNVAPNYDEQDRCLEIRLYSDADYYNTVINNENLGYRLLTVNQPTYIADMGPDVTKIKVPEFSNPYEDQIIYYTLTNDNDPSGTALYVKYDDYLPLEGLIDVALGYSPDINYVTLKGYDSNNGLLVSETFNINTAFCFTTLFKNFALAADIFIGTFQNNIAVNDFIIPSDKSMVFFVPSSLRLLPGFHAENGSYFYADTRICINDFKSAKDGKDGKDQRIISSIDMLNIYPNPTTGIFNIKLNSEIENINFIEIYDAQGRLLCNTIPQKQPVEFNLSTYSQGIYFIRAVFKDNTIQSGKILLKK